MITPLMYYADYRPYFTIHDSEFREYTTRTHAPPPIILGVTNPFFAKTLQHWPHIIKVPDSSNGSFQKHKIRKGNHLKMLDTKPGVYTQYQPFLQKDKTILKKVLKGVQTKRPGEVQSALLRRHLLELTQSFMIPLERYMGTLMPLQKNISPYKGSLLAGLYLPVEPTTGHSKNRCATSIWATLWMSSSGTSLTANVEILGFMGNSIVGGVCSLTSEVLVNLNKGVPPPAYFDWRGWFRAGLPFFWDDFEMRRPLLPNLTHPEYPITPEAAQRFLQD
ncbi:Protein dennd6a [Homalodisca vitripennis]|nr:Protein dennd6a [Homalodisca vitripennis]